MNGGWTIASETSVKTLPDRSEIAEELTWRLEDIFASDEDWEKEYEGIKESLKDAGQFKGKLMKVRKIYLRVCNIDQKFLNVWESFIHMHICAPTKIRLIRIIKV